MRTTGKGIEVLEWALNQALAADPEVREELEEMDGVRVRIAVAPLLRPLDLTFVGSRIEVSRPQDAGDGYDVDVALAGSTSALAAFLLRSNAPDTLPPGISVKGDLALAVRLARLVRRYRFDWEENLSRYLGDAGAHETARLVRGAGRFGLSTADLLARDVAEYLSEESGLVAGEAALARFCAAVDELRDDVERLEARIARLALRTEEGRS